MLWNTRILLCLAKNKVDFSALIFILFAMEHKCPINNFCLQKGVVLRDGVDLPAVYRHCMPSASVCQGVFTLTQHRTKTRISVPISLGPAMIYSDSNLYLGLGWILVPGMPGTRRTRREENVFRLWVYPEDGTWSLECPERPYFRCEGWGLEIE